MHGFPSAKRKNTGGGPIVGPGTGTSDSIQKQAPVGSFIMPADSTAAIGHDSLARLGLSKKSATINVSNGEHELPPEQVHAIGIQALRGMKDETHAEVVEQDNGPQQFFVNGGGVLNPEELKKKQASFDVTNTPSTQLGIRSAQAAMDSAMQAGAVRNGQPVTAPGYSSFSPARDLQRADDSRQQHNAIAQADTAQRALLGEAVTTDAGQRAIKTALTPATPAAAPGNPERAARMQAQFDQPVTKGYPPQNTQPVAAGITAPSAENQSAFAGGLRGAMQAGVGALAYPPSAVYDGVRNAAGYLAGGDTSQIKQYRDGAADVFSAGADEVSKNAAELRESSAASVRNALGIDKRKEPAALAATEPASNPYTGRQFDQWAQQQAPSVQVEQAQPGAQSQPSAPTADSQGYVRTGIGSGSQGGEIVGRVGANGVPEFTNNAQAQSGALGMPKAGMSRVGNGVGTFTQQAPGTASAAMASFDRANEIRAGMQRPRELGDNGGQLNIVKDSSRTPTLQERKLARLEGQQAQTAELQNRGMREDRRLGIDSRRLDAQDARNQINDSINNQKTQQEIQAGQLSLESAQRTEQLRQMLADPSVQGADRDNAEAAYASLTNGEKDRYMQVTGGTNGLGGKDASMVFDKRLGKMVGASSAPAVSGQPPQNHVAALKNNPAQAAQFDEIYGAGAAARILGGK